MTCVRLGEVFAAAAGSFLETKMMFLGICDMCISLFSVLDGVLTLVGRSFDAILSMLFRRYFGYTDAISHHL